MKCISNVIAIVVETVFALSAAASTQEHVMHSGRATFISGGVEETSAERLAALATGFNLKLPFAAKDGHYLSEVAVQFEDARNTKVLETVSEGPFLFARLGAGNYPVTTIYGDIPSKRVTPVWATGRRDLAFCWDEQADLTRVFVRSHSAGPSHACASTETQSMFDSRVMLRINYTLQRPFTISNAAGAPPAYTLMLMPNAGDMMATANDGNLLIDNLGTRASDESPIAAGSR